MTPFQPSSFCARLKGKSGKRKKICRTDLAGLSHLPPLPHPVLPPPGPPPSATSPPARRHSVETFFLVRARHSPHPPTPGPLLGRHRRGPGIGASVSSPKLGRKSCGNSQKKLSCQRFVKWFSRCKLSISILKKLKLP
ncbi:uncharacterized protein LOC120682292 isoform X2 [Panicum virgatum]|uniref:uncharacterized protein LOC120682292 isoform X2 n=1 Tax=Panicum virgatum TaxID=38727 RepID=UPI0019D52292|nr:uncharacterized protein LOC120682292 isoform X2 [Panicum virgatum]